MSLKKFEVYAELTYSTLIEAKDTEEAYDKFIKLVNFDDIKNFVIEEIDDE